MFLPREIGVSSFEFPEVGIVLPPYKVPWEHRLEFGDPHCIREEGWGLGWVSLCVYGCKRVEEAQPLHESLWIFYLGWGQADSRIFTIPTE